MEVGKNLILPCQALCCYLFLFISSWTALHLLLYLGVCLLCHCTYSQNGYPVTSWTSLAICWASLDICEFPQYLQFMRIYLLVDIVLSNVLFLCLCLFTVSRTIQSFVSSMSIFHTLCSSILLVQVTRWSSMVISFVFLTKVYSHMISVIILSSFMPLINFSFSLLSLSSYLLSFWGSPSILHHSYFALLLLIIARMILFHCIVA